MTKGSISMDITKLDINDIELFDLANSVAEQVFGIEPIKASPKKQKKIRKWVNKTYLVIDDLPKKVLCFVDKSKSDFEFIEFMTECSKYIKEKGTLKRQLFDKVAENFSEDVKKAFLDLFETIEACENVEKQKNKIIFTLDETDSYTRKLVLHSSEENVFSKFDMLQFRDAQILKDEKGYKLICEAENFEKETVFPIGIFFDNATVEVDIYRADHTQFVLTPWNTLVSIATEILSKKELGDEYFNQQEKELMPLVKEISGLSLFSHLLDNEPQSFEILKQYINKHNVCHLIPLLDKVKEHFTKISSRQILLAHLDNKLNDKKCEPLWRELYGLIAETQKGYPDKILSYNQKKLNKIRQQIEQSLHNLGYEGKYPTFNKKGAIKDIRLEESYNQTYFVGLEKNAEYIIHCTESMYNGELQIQFICGTALLKKNEAVTDIYSCCFNAKGRRLYKTVYFSLDSEANLLDRYAKIAAKKAECIKLNKYERELFGNDFIPWGNFFTVLFFAGGLFAALMTVAMILFVCVMTIIEEGFSAVPETIGMMPWWQCFLCCFFGFGIPMAIVETKAKRK